MDRIIMHIDVNSAFLSWSSLKLLSEGSNIDLRNEIAVVSGKEESRHGIVVASSIPAKKIGIKSPMNLRDARRIYKDLIVTHADKEYYKKCSNNMMKLIKYLFFFFFFLRDWDIGWRAVLRWQRNRTRRPLSSSQIHQKII